MKQITLKNSTDTRQYIETLERSASATQLRISNLFDSSGFMAALKFEHSGCDPLNPDRPLNFIEQLNQHFTYLASFQAAEQLFKWLPGINQLNLNLGTTGGSDIESDDGDIACEIFAAVHPGSNQKLKKDVEKVSATVAKHKYVFFICPEISAGKYEAVNSHGVTIWSLGMPDGGLVKSNRGSKPKPELSSTKTVGCLCCEYDIPVQKEKICPICQYEFKGPGWDGIDTHWKSRHAEKLGISYWDFRDGVCKDHWPRKR